MRGETNRGAICGIIGIVAAITGVVLIFFGNYMANGYSSFYINLDYYYQTGTFDTTGKNLVTAGIVLIVIGAVLLFLSLYFAIKERKQFSEKIHNQDYDEFDDPYLEDVPPVSNKKPDFPDWYKREYSWKGDDEYEVRNLAQIVYEATGCLMPRNLHRYDAELRKRGEGNDIRIYSGYTGISAGQKNAGSHCRPRQSRDGCRSGR